jgi:hypothetical protein
MEKARNLVVVVVGGSEREPCVVRNRRGGVSRTLMFVHRPGERPPEARDRRRAGHQPRCSVSVASPRLTVTCSSYSFLARASLTCTGGFRREMRWAYSQHWLLPGSVTAGRGLTVAFAAGDRIRQRGVLVRYVEELCFRARRDWHRSEILLVVCGVTGMVWWEWYWSGGSRQLK